MERLMRVRRAVDALRRFNASTIDLQERFLRAQRPWERDQRHRARVSHD